MKCILHPLHAHTLRFLELSRKGAIIFIERLQNVPIVLKSAVQAFKGHPGMLPVTFKPPPLSFLPIIFYLRYKYYQGRIESGSACLQFLEAILPV